MSTNETNSDDATQGAVFGREPSGRATATDEIIDITDDDVELDEPTTEPGAVQPDAGADVEAGTEPVPVGVAEPEPEPEPEPQPVAEAPGPATRRVEPAPETVETPEQVLAADELADRWDAAKVVFVDDPRRAVERAAELVNEALSGLEERWRNGNTEELRTAFQHYRAVFDAVCADAAS